MLPIQVDDVTEIRSYAEDDASLLFSVIDKHRADLARWLPWVQDTHGAEDSLNFIRWAAGRQHSGDGFAGGIWRGGVFSGGFGAHPGSRLGRSVDLGYWLAPEARGKGIITACCRAVTGLLFGQGYNRVVIKCAPGNQESWRVPERLGFVLEGVEREGELLNGEFTDLRVYSMLSRDWRRD
ncbi:MAG: GNAT family N-acetyltransferase [Acidobacteria bacterium]|nr:GNAT family N-acetyltransferase [Acidobacteriota bacterium]